MTFVNDHAVSYRVNAYLNDRDREFLTRLRTATMPELHRLQKEHRRALEWKRAAIGVAMRRVMYATEVTTETASVRGQT